MPATVIAGPVTVRPAHALPNTPQSRAHFLDFFYGPGQGGQGYQSGQGAVSTTLSAIANLGDGTITVTDATGIVAGMGLTIVSPNPVQWPLLFQQFIVTSVSSFTVTLTAPKVGIKFPVGALVVATWTNDTHLANWYWFGQWILDARIRQALGGQNVIPPLVGSFVGWSAGSTSIPDGWVGVGTATFARASYQISQATAQARASVNNATPYGVSVTTHAGTGEGIDIGSPIPVTVGQRYTLAAYVRMQQTGGTAVANMNVFDATRARSVTDAVTNSTTTITSATAAFTAADKGALVRGAGIPQGATIVHVASATSILISAAATATATGVTFYIDGPIIAVKTFGDPQVAAGVDFDVLAGLTRVTVPFTVPVGCTQISFGVRIPATSTNIYLSDVQLLGSRQDTTQNKRVIEDPGSYGIAVVGDSWGRGLFDSGAFAAACKARFGRTINLIDSCHTGDNINTMLSRVDGILGASPQRTVTDGVLNGTTTVTSAAAAFTAADQGALLVGTGIPVGATIITVTNATTVVISTAATVTATGVTLQVGSGQPPAYLVIASTYMNEGTSPTLANVARDTMSIVTKCRDAGTVCVILGVGNRNSALLNFAEMNEALRTAVNTDIGSLILNDASVGALAG